jgi:hypothetical protein
MSLKKRMNCLLKLGALVLGLLVLRLDAMELQLVHPDNALMDDCVSSSSSDKEDNGFMLGSSDESDDESCLSSLLEQIKRDSDLVNFQRLNSKLMMVREVAHDRDYSDCGTQFMADFFPLLDWQNPAAMQCNQHIIVIFKKIARFGACDEELLKMALQIMELELYPTVITQRISLGYDLAGVLLLRAKKLSESIQYRDLCQKYMFIEKKYKIARPLDHYWSRQEYFDARNLRYSSAADAAELANAKKRAGNERGQCIIS